MSESATREFQDRLTGSSSQLRNWAVENRAIAALTTNSETAAALRSAADQLDALAEAKEAEDASSPDRFVTSCIFAPSRGSAHDPVRHGPKSSVR